MNNEKLFLIEYYNKYRELLYVKVVEATDSSEAIEKYRKAHYTEAACVIISNLFIKSIDKECDK